MNIAFISAILPVLLLLWFIYRKDRLNPEPLGKLLLTFFVGCLSVIPAGLLEAMLMPLAPDAATMPCTCIRRFPARRVLPPPSGARR